MAFRHLYSCISALNRTGHFNPHPSVLRTLTSVLRTLTSKSNLVVEHDRQNMRFTIRLDSESGDSGGAVLRYRFTGDKEVDLMSTVVPETFRGRGVAALLSKAAMDFLAEENLKAHISCWYIKKYIEENPLLGYKDLIVS